ncbi:MAG: ubiquinol-cytochrome c reductase iron-sulfur subunit [Terriglobia bacterium]
MRNSNLRSSAPNHPAPPASGRRRLLGFLLGSGVLASLASVLYPILKFVLPPRSGELDTNTVVAARVGELSPNAGKIFRFGNHPGLLIRLPDGTYRAFTAVCTHLSCTVQYRSRQHDIWCACHNGVYDLHGRNVSGPPPRPLEHYDVHVRGEEIVVARRARA